MDNFKEVKLNVEEQKKLEQYVRDLQHEYLFVKVGYKRQGVFIITFPNAKVFIGRSKCMGYRLKEIFAQLFWNNKPRQKWIEKAKEENKGLMKDFRDLSIKIVYTEPDVYEEAYANYLQLAAQNVFTEYYNHDIKK
jgi:hypothetical protein